MTTHPLLYSKGGDLVAAMPRIGGEILLIKPMAKQKRIYEGICPIAPSLGDALLRRPECVLFDTVGDEHYPMGVVADRLRRRIPVYGIGEIQEHLELDRAFGMALMADCGIRIPQTILFDPVRGKGWEAIDLEDRARVHRTKGHIPEAIKFLKAVGGRWVLKPMENAATALTYVSKDPDDMIHRLENIRENRQIKPNAGFLLQKFVPGVEVSTELWFVNGEPVYPATGTIETKKFLAGDLGPATGCQTSVVWAYETDAPKILRQTLARPDFLAWMKHPKGPKGESYPPYHGPIDLNGIVSEEDKKVYGLEWTARFGYNAIYAMLELLDDDMHDLFVGAAQGTLERINLHQGYAYALRVSCPPYPALDEIDDPHVIEKMMAIATDIDIMGPVDDPHIWLLDAQKDKDHYQTAGYDAVVMEITSHGRTVEDARDGAHALFEEITLADKQARVADGADRAIKDLARLQAFGYDTPQLARIAPRIDEKLPEKPPPIPTEPRAQEQVLRAMATAGAGAASPGDAGGRPGAPGASMISGQANPAAAGAGAHNVAGSGAESGGAAGAGAKSVAG